MNDVAAIKEALVKARLRQRTIESENRILGYRPCCVAHHPNACPIDCNSSKHLQFHKSLAKSRWFFGGNSSGKSVAGLAEHVIHTTFNTHPYSGVKLPHPAFHRMGFESFRNLESYYLPILKEWIPRKMLVGGSWSDAYNVKYNLLRLVNGDLIDYLSYDMEVSKFESSTLHTFWGDEKIPEDIYDATLARLLRTNGYFWSTVTALNGMPWILSRVWGVNTEDTQTWVVDMDENPYLDESAKKRIMAEWSPEEREARKSGKPMQFQGLVYPELEESVHMTTLKPEPFWPMYFVMDAHPRKEAHMAWFCVDPGGAGYVADELQLRGTPQELAERIFQKEYAIRQWIGAPVKGVQRRWIDLSAITNDSDIQNHYDLMAEFRKVGLPFSNANRSSVGYQTTKQYLHYDHSKPVGPFNKPMLYFCRGRVPKTWFSMTHLMYEEYRHHGSKDPKEKVKDWGKDPADCVRYFCIERPKYQPLMTPVAYGNADAYTRMPAYG